MVNKEPRLRAVSARERTVSQAIVGMTTYEKGTSTWLEPPLPPRPFTKPQTKASSVDIWR